MQHVCRVRSLQKYLHFVKINYSKNIFFMKIWLFWVFILIDVQVFFIFKFETSAHICRTMAFAWRIGFDALRLWSIFKFFFRYSNVWKVVGMGGVDLFLCLNVDNLHRSVFCRNLLCWGPDEKVNLSLDCAFVWVP